MTRSSFQSGAAIEAVAALAASDGPAVLALITGVEGPSYRPVGAMMALFADGRRVGSLSSGCIEADIATHGQEALAAGRPRLLRYGLGSPFKDIALPCGGGLDILLVPNPDRSILDEARACHAARRPVSLMVDRDSGALHLGPATATGWQSAVFAAALLPELQFFIFGKGPEASTFAALVQSGGYPNRLLSPDVETLAVAEAGGSATTHLVSQTFPTGLEVDDRSAIVLFFHDHEWEPPLLQGAVATPAFYIGAQGSARARALRDLALEKAGIGPAEQARIRGPIGLVRSARDARTLAVGVLAEVLSDAP